jgi:5-methylcytosine-specific restriction protein A
MPVGAPHPCAGRCGALVPRGQSRCAACAQRVTRARGGARARGYDSRWEALRELWLKKHPLCVDCEKQGKLTSANTVDHVTPWQSGATEALQQFMRFDMNNLQSMCAPCHSRKTALHDGGFGHARTA